MKNLFQRFSYFLALALLGVPLAWAVSFSGMTVKTVPQLSFDTRSLQADAASPDALTRSVGAGAFTLKALSPYSKGGITYSSSAPGVATVNPATGEVTPLSNGKVVITANQAAQSPFPAATARYTLTLTGIQVTYKEWKLANRDFGSGDVDLKQAPPQSDPVHPSPIVYSSATPELVTVTNEGIVKLLKIGTATVVATQAATGNYAEGKVTATFQVNAADPGLKWENVKLRLGAGTLQLTKPVSANTDPAAAFSYAVEGNLATVSGDVLTAQRAGTTKITATQKAHGNYSEGKVTVDLEVLPAQVTATLADIKQALSADAAKNVITLKAEAGNLPAGVNPPRFQYTVDDTSVASVDPVTLDKLTLLKAGTAKITATLLPDADGQYEGASAQATLTVDPIPSTTVAYNAWTPSPTVHRYGDAPFKLTPPTSTPSHPGAITYALAANAPTDVVTIAADGTVTILKAGKVTVEATQAAVAAPAPGFAEGKVQGQLEVKPALVTLALADITHTLDADAAKNTIDLSATVSSLPANIPAAVVTYTLKDTPADVAAIVGSTLTLKKPVTTNISVTVEPAKNGDRLEAEPIEARLTVNAPTAVTYQAWTLPDREFGTSFKLSDTPPVANPAHDGKITYSTTTPNVLTVDPDDGAVTLQQVGQATVVANQAAKGPLAAGRAEASFQVVPGPLTLSWGEPLKIMLDSGEQTLTPPVSPNTHADAGFSYAIDDPTIATVQDNKLTPLKVGKAKLTVTQAAAGNYKAGSVTKDLEVTPLVVGLSLADIDRTYDAANNVVTLAATAIGVPAGAVPEMAYGSSDPSVASVSGNQLTLHKAGSALITASLAAKPGVYDAAVATAKLMVRAPAEGGHTINDLTATYGTESIDLPAVTVQAGATPNPGPRTFTVDNGTVAAINNGRIFILGAGTAWITLDIPQTNGVAAVKATAKLTVLPGSPKLGMAAMQRTTAQGAFIPATTTVSTGELSFSIVRGDGTVATIVNNQVLPVAAGTATVRVTQAAQGNYQSESAEAELTVNTAAPKLSIAVDVYNLGAPKFMPSVATNSSGTRRFSSSNEAVATVDATSGEITVVGVGSSTITVEVAATPVFSAASASATLTVNKVPAQLAVSGATRALSAGAFPLNITTRSTGALSLVTIDKPEVATVAGSGFNWTVTPLSTGTATVTVTQSADGNHFEASATATLTFTGLLAPSIQWSPITQWAYNAAGNNTFTLSKPTSNSGGAFQYESDTPAVATVDRNTGVVTVNGLGSTSLRAVQAATGSHLGATVTSTLTVQQSGTQAMQETYAATPIQKRYGDLPFQVVSQPSMVLSGINPLTWTMTGYTSTDSSVLSVSGNVATIVKPGNATIEATWRNPDNGNVVVVKHPFQILKALPQTRLNFTSPLVLPFSTTRITPSILTASDAPIQLLSAQSEIAMGDGDGILPKLPATVKIFVRQDETALYEAFTTSFELTLKTNTPGLTDFPDRSFTLDASQSTEVVFVPPKSASPAAFTYDSSNKTVAEVVDNRLVLKAPGSTVITARQPASGAYEATQITATYTVLAAVPQLVFDSEPASLTLGQPTLVRARSSNLQEPVNYSTNSAIATVDAVTGLVTPQSPGTVEIVATQKAFGVFGLTQASKVFNIVAPADLRLADMSARVGDAAFVPPWTSNSSAAVSFQVIPVTGDQVVSLDSSTNQITPTGAGTVMIRLQQAATATLGAASTLARLTVKPALPVIGGGLPASYSKAYPATQTFDLPILTSTNTGVALQFASSNIGVATVVAKGDGSATVTLVGLGTTRLTVSQLAGNGWDAVSIEVPLTVVAGTADAEPFKTSIERPYASPDFKLAAQLDNGAVVTGYTSSNPAVAQVLPDGFTVRIVDVGSTTLKAMQNGTEVGTGQLTVVKARQSLDFADRTLVTPTAAGASPTETLQASASSGLPVTFALTGGDRDMVHLGGAEGRTLWLLWDSLWDRDMNRNAQVQITATQAGNPRYEPVSATRTFTLQRPVDVPTAWYEVIQGPPAQVPEIMPSGASAYTVRVRHNMSPRRQFGANAIKLEGGVGTIRCRVDGIQRGRSPEEDTLITLVLEGGVGKCIVNMVALDDGDVSVPGPIGAVEGKSLSNTALGNTVYWPPLVLQYGTPVPSHFYTNAECADSMRASPNTPPAEFTSSDGAKLCPPDGIPFGTPVAPFKFDGGAGYVRALTDGVVRLSASHNGIEGDPGDPNNNPPRAVPIGVGVTRLTGVTRSGPNLDLVRVSTTVTVVPGTPRVSGWDTDVVLTLGAGPKAIAAPLSTSPGNMSFAVSPPGLATIDLQGRVTPVREGNGFLTMHQAATSNYAEITVTRPLWVVAAPPPVDFGTVSRAYGDTDFSMKVPADITGGQHFTAASSKPEVVEVTADASNGTLRVSIQGAGSSTISVSQGGVVKATATVNILKAMPQLSLTMVDPFRVTQRSCWAVPVQFPVLNAEPYVANVNGMQTFLGARLSSFSPGTVTYRTSAPALLPIDAGSSVGTLVKPASWDTWGRVNGLPLDLEIIQAETANYLGQTLRIPNAISVYSPAPGDFLVRPWPVPDGMAHTGAVLRYDGVWVVPEGATSCPQ